MKLLFQIVVIAIFALIFQLLAPWWAVIPAAAFGGFAISNQGKKAFLAGFLGIFLLWLLQIYVIDSANSSILSDRVAGIMNLPSGTLLILISALIGGICGGLGAAIGSSLRELMS